MNELVPILTREGCNSGACHGTPSGKNGFRLSLRGYDPALDYQSLTRDAEGRRRLLACVREAAAAGDETKLRPALVLLWASQHLDNLWRLESHLGRRAQEASS